ncbi:hypothetical protein [Roseibium alexandrii]|uniref:hypothetical protein n=1 Tax=Roseibium alexandrii TaxID=388408 RepID=UPI0037506CFA
MSDDQHSQQPPQAPAQEQQTEQAVQTPEKSQPSHIAYHVNETDSGKSYFNRVGSAFEHKDGQGYNVVLESTPVDGRITLRTPQERLKQAREGKASSRDNQDMER